MTSPTDMFSLLSIVCSLDGAWSTNTKRLVLSIVAENSRHGMRPSILTCMKREPGASGDRSTSVNVIWPFQNSFGEHGSIGLRLYKFFRSGHDAFRTPSLCHRPHMQTSMGGPAAWNRS